MTSPNDRIADMAASQDATDIDHTATPSTIIIDIVTVPDEPGAAADATAATASTTATAATNDTLKAVGTQIPSRRPSLTPAGIPDTEIEIVGKDPGPGPPAAPAAVPAPVLPTVIVSDPAPIPAPGPDRVVDNVPVSPRPRQGQPDASRPVRTYERPQPNNYTATNTNSLFQNPIINHPDTDLHFDAHLLPEPEIPNAADMQLTRFGEVTETLQNDVNISRIMAELAGSVGQPNMFNSRRASAGGVSGPTAIERCIAAGAHLQLPPKPVQVGSYSAPSLVTAPSVLAFRDSLVPTYSTLAFDAAVRESLVNNDSHSLVVHARSAGSCISRRSLAVPKHTLTVQQRFKARQREFARRRRHH